VSGVVWNLHLSAAAERDYRDILGWTLEHFGQMQVQAYADTLTFALKSLVAGPGIAGVKQRAELGVDIYSLHVARNGRKGRHFVIFRVNISQDQNTIDVLRILHDSMDLLRHLHPIDSD
jgi:toxin ParE1/3/4